MNLIIGRATISPENPQVSCHSLDRIGQLLIRPQNKSVHIWPLHPVGDLTRIQGEIETAAVASRRQRVSEAARSSGSWGMLAAPALT